jgi:hypothetical protein
MGRTAKLCKYCNQMVTPLLKHIQGNHPAEYQEQEELVISLWEEGVSSRKIADRDDIIFTGGTSVRRVMNKHLTKEELEQGRRTMIGKDVKRAYADGERDWVTDLNIARNKSEEGRRKNSEGLKKAYDDGRKVAWKTGLTKENSEKVRLAAEKTSETMKAKFNSEIDDDPEAPTSTK